MVRSQSFLYDDSAFVVYNTDVRMRWGQDERFRQRTEWDHAAIRSADSTSFHNSAKPRDAVSTMAVSGKVWCNGKLRRPGRWHCTTCSGAQRCLNCPGIGDTGSPTRLPQALTEVQGVREISLSP